MLSSYDQFEYTYEGPALGQLGGIYLRHDGSGLASDWHVDTVWICDRAAGIRYEYVYQNEIEDGETPYIELSTFEVTHCY